MDLADQHCAPCHRGTSPLTREQIAPLAARLPGWQVVDDHHLWREFRLPDFRRALELVVAIGAEAEAQGHHPDLELGWGRVGVTVFTHASNGLQEADFVLAARIDRIRERLPADEEGS